MLVRELMSTDVVTVDREATLADAAEQLLAHSVGSVIITDDGAPIGILTESDVIEAGYETGEPFAAVDVVDVGQRPLITTKPSASVSLVADKMATRGVKKVPVMADMDLVGIVTFTDIVSHLSDIRREAGELDSAREQWENRE